MISFGFIVLIVLALVVESQSVDGYTKYWCQYQNTYLDDLSNGTNSFYSLHHAKNECFLRGVTGPNACGGVTYDEVTDSYTLRRNTELKSTDRYQISWKLCGKDNCTNERHERDYRGNIKVTKDGKTCAAWSKRVKQTKAWGEDKGLDDNFCRNPNSDPHGTWCYLSDGSIGRCDNIEQCTGAAECSDEKLQKDYRGTKDTSMDGLKCMAWDSQSPHVHNTTPETYPYSGLVGSYCRNPNNKPEGAWCYTMDPAIEWTYCGVSTCGKIPECQANSQRDAAGVCVCNAGYNDYNGECFDINECVDTNICGANEDCVDTEGSYECVCISCKTRGAGGQCTVNKYTIYDQPMLWDDAQIFCEQKELKLAKIQSDEDQAAFVKELDAVYHGVRAERRFDNSNWLWIGGTDTVTQGTYMYTDGDELAFTPPWGKNQDDNWVKNSKSGPEDYVAVSKWGEWDDSYGKLWQRSFACSC